MNIRPDNIVLIHGLERIPYLTRPIGRRLSRLGYGVHYFDYPSHSLSLEQVIHQFLEFLDRKQLTNWAGIGYSLGGVVLWHTLARELTCPPTHCVFLGSPLRGAKLAKIIEKIPFSSHVFGPALHDLTLDHTPLPHKYAPPFLGIAGISGSRFLFLPFLGEDNDGLVALSETKSERIPKHLSVHALHIQLVLGRKCIAPIDSFLRDARE